MWEVNKITPEYEPKDWDAWELLETLRAWDELVTAIEVRVSGTAVLDPPNREPLVAPGDAYWTSELLEAIQVTESPDSELIDGILSVDGQGVVEGMEYFDNIEDSEFIAVEAPSLRLINASPFEEILTYDYMQPVSVGGSVGGAGIWTRDPSDFNTTGKGADFIALVDNTENIIITSCSDKNIYIQPASYNASLSDVGCTVSWQNVEDSVVADGNGRVLHYYTNTMTTLNVSRLRISDEEDIPKQSEYVSLYAYGSDGALDKNTFDDPEDSDNFYYAVDRKDNVFYPVVCEYKNATAIPKIFLVADLDAGIALLESAELETIVTGAPVSKCSFMPMQQAFDNIDEDAEF
ncbi:hypothetical protein D6C78_10822 [Aureobasidium pullulans]|uniref:Uncharacterized protein n=1 Tax=Aureobasidium pullulans TaxID=5580 RepID=A0A4T0B2T3_AURPU|nr:hypothetical protein D6C78_10822 [Aureobasidium pullulans]